MNFDLLIEGATLIPAAFEAPIADAAIGITGGRFAFIGPRAALPAGSTATQRLALGDGARWRCTETG